MKHALSTSTVTALAAIALSLLFATLTGCANDQIARKSANFGVGVIGEMEVSLTEFRQAEAESAKARQVSLKSQHALAKSAMNMLAQSSRSRELAGDSQAQATTQKLLLLADTMKDDLAALEEFDRLNSELNTALVSPLPSTKAATAEAQETLAALGAAVPAKDQYTDVRSYISAVRETVKVNRQKLKEARAATPPDVDSDASSSAVTTTATTTTR
ncbi:hypothetical protein [Rugamonas rubra]|uniref:DUF4398 domain-containing protein n=1 Tax=Rugamonas rubra TaxID=758825 RepID=A0A1I4R8W2_9BURK|nr:hypothetical protein [Rugamonas rubra]SFM48744.1 hypothetical protein SAMN02982985_04260 [Rugamonas rubra]